MASDGNIRQCRCGTRLARDNCGRLCSTCQKAARASQQSPAVPAAFWQSAEMRAALASEDMGQVVRAFRQHPFHGQDIPQAVVANWFGIHQSRISRIENGEPLTDLAKLARWSAVLGIPKHQRWFRHGDGNEASVRRDAPSPSIDQQADAAETGLLPVAIKGTVVLVPLRATSSVPPELIARTLDARLSHPASSPERATASGQAVPVAELAVAGLEQVHRLAVALQEAQQGDSTLVELFDEHLTACMAADGTHGAGRTLPDVLTLLVAINAGARDVAVPLRRQLVALAARGAEFAGWLYRDSGEVARAVGWYDRATALAQEAGDLPLQGYILLRRSQMAYDERDASQVLTLADAAYNGPWQLASAVRAEVTQQRARGLAMIGEPFPVVERLLQEAAELMAQTEPTPSAGLLLLRHASCYLEAGRPRQAAEFYAQVLDGDALSRRDRGYFTARMASALALAGEPDEAAASGLMAAEVAGRTSSRRTVRELRRTLTTLQPWRSRPGPRQLREAVAAAL